MFRQLRGAVGRLVVTREDNGQPITLEIATVFVISKDGYAVTTAHSVKLGSESSKESGKILTLSVTLGSRFTLPLKAELIKVDDDLDLALIKLPGSSVYPALRIS